MILFTSLDELCPCESGKKIRDCCPLWGDNGLVPWDVETKTPGPKTGYAHQGCYAAATNDCCSKISKEHFVSQGVLDLMTFNGGVFVSVMRGMTQDETALRSKAALQANVLCRRHNSALSGLDGAGQKMFRKLNDILYEFYHGPADVVRHYLLSGHDFERWMLKLVCGAVASGNHSIRLPHKNKNVPEIWLRWLFGLEDFPEGLGLYFVDRRRGPIPSVPGISWNMLWDTTGTEILGALIECQGLDFILCLSEPPEVTQGTVFEGSTYRPCGISFAKSKNRRASVPDRKTISLGWRTGDRRTFINIQVADGVDQRLLDELYKPY